MKEPTVVEVWNDAGLLRERLTELAWNNQHGKPRAAESLVAKAVAYRISELTGMRVEVVWGTAMREARLLERDVE